MPTTDLAAIPSSPKPSTQPDRACIAKALHLPVSAIRDIRIHPGGLNNDLYRVTLMPDALDGTEAILIRFDGIGADLFSDRVREAQRYKRLASFDLSDEVLSIDPINGIKISREFPSARIVNPNGSDDLDLALDALRYVHNHPDAFTVPHEQPTPLADRCRRFAAIAAAHGAMLSQELLQLTDNLLDRLAERPTDDSPLTVIHGDFIPDNVLILPDGSARLIDWEFTAIGDPLEDLANFCSHSDASTAQSQALLTRYLRRQPTDHETSRFNLYRALTALLWVSWSETKLNLGCNKLPLQAFRTRMESYAKAVARELFGNTGSKPPLSENPESPVP